VTGAGLRQERDRTWQLLETARGGFALDKS
jgi:hypothetical protein